jgi:hypothetical protein
MPKAYSGEMRKWVIAAGRKWSFASRTEQLEISAGSHGFDLFCASLELCWFWSILDIVTVSGVTLHGHAPTLDEAKAKRWRLIDGQSCGLRRRVAWQKLSTRTERER